MFMQNEIKEKGNLLDWFGNLYEAGYSKKIIRDYYKEDVKASKIKLKEWDYYLVYNDDFGVALTVADNGYMGMLSASVIRFKDKTEITKSKISWFTLGKFEMPTTSVTGDVEVKAKGCKAKFLHTDGGRYLEFFMPNFDGKKDLSVSFELTDEPEESMVIYTPFEKKKHFYYNQKIVGFKASGKVRIGDEEINFNQDDTNALLDWGRGVWTYKNTWYWGAAMGYVGGKKVGFNIGYGFGDTSKATENMLFYDGKAHKIQNVRFLIPKKNGKDDFMSKWRFTSDDGRFEMEFEPIINRHARINALVLESNQNQVFGKFSGQIILDSSERIQIDNMLGFAEKVFNRW